MPEQVEARYNAAFHKGWTVFLGAWVAVGAVMLAAGIALMWPPLRVLGVSHLAVFLPLLVYARVRMASPLPVISIGPEGFLDSRLGTPVPWREITWLRRQISGSRIILQIEVDAPERFLKRTGLVPFLMRWLNPKMRFPVLGSNLSGMDVPQERLAAAAEGWWEAARAG